VGALSDRIGDLEPKGKYENEDWATGFYAGTEEAANLAKEADELMEEMATVIDSIIGECALKALDDVLNSEPCHEACEIIERYNTWKERTK
jgi:hypothetical protein